MRLRGIAALLFAAMPAVVAAQAPAAATLTITGSVERPVTLSAADLAKMPRVSVEVRGRQATVTYTGVLLFDVLKLAGAPVGERLHGPFLASYVMAEARDGYRVLFSLPEIDPGFTDAKVLVADHANGKELGSEQGPFRLVPADKSARRTVRMLQRLEVATAPK
ncbi:MAG TPA: molybdopterin-dependent oxidoreductase [Bryobacterales bacterium]|nr:molybdopterin-dependent oxidoreductase [Bryobacterales bacterium]